MHVRRRIDACMTNPGSRQWRKDVSFVQWSQCAWQLVHHVDQRLPL